MKVKFLHKVTQKAKQKNLYFLFLWLQLILSAVKFFFDKLSSIISPAKMRMHM